MPSSIGFWAILMMFYFLSSKSGCKFFNWFQKKLKVRNAVKLKPVSHNYAMSTLMELISILWTFYLVLLLIYDSNFFGDRHPVTYIIAFGSLLWSGYLFTRLIKINKLDYGIRYSIPTVIIFWNFVEIMGRWDVFKEIWVEPGKYWLEMIIISIVFVLLILITTFEKKKRIKV